MLDGYYCVGVTLRRLMLFRRLTPSVSGRHPPCPRGATLVLGIVLAVSFLPVVAEGNGKAQAAAGKPNIRFILLYDMPSYARMNNPTALPQRTPGVSAPG